MTPGKCWLQIVLAGRLLLKMVFVQARRKDMKLGIPREKLANNVQPVLHPAPHLNMFAPDAVETVTQV